MPNCGANAGASSELGAAAPGSTVLNVRMRSVIVAIPVR